MSYQTKVYHEQGGGAEVLQSGGILRGLSGGYLSVESGFVALFASGQILADDLRRILVSEQGGEVTIGVAAATTTFSVLNLPKNIRVVILSAHAGLAQGSFWLTSVSAGREVFLYYPGYSGAVVTGSVVVSCSGCIILDSVGVSVSRFHMINSASRCMVQLLAAEDNVWSIVRQHGDINEGT